MDADAAAAWRRRAIALYVTRAPGPDSMAAVVSVLEVHFSAIEVARWACRALAVLAATPAGLEEAVRSCPATPIVLALQAHISNACVAEQACRALRTLVSDPKDRATLGLATQSRVPRDARAPATALLALHTHVDSANVVREALKMLGRSGWRSMGDAAPGGNAHGVVVAAMRGHMRDADVAALGCLALENMSIPVSEAESAAAAGGPAAVVEALKAHRADPDVAYFGCRALAEMAVSALGETRAVAAGAPAAVVSALMRHASSTPRRFIGSPSMMPYACEVLARTARSSPEARLAAIDAGAPAAITKTLPLGGDGAMWGLRALHCYGELPRGLRAMREAGAAARTSRITSFNANLDSEITLWSCLVLEQCLADASCVPEAVEHHAARGVVRTLNAQAEILPPEPRCVRTASAATAVIRDLARDPEGLHQLLLLNAPAAVVEVMAAHASSEGLARRGCMALGAIAATPDGRLAVVAAGGHAAIVTAMGYHESADAVGAAALACLAQPVPVEPPASQPGPSPPTQPQAEARLDHSSHGST